jgi:hypothetical protein
VTAATYFACYSKMLGLLGPDRPAGGIADADLAILVELSAALARTHALLDRHRVNAATRTVQGACQRAEDIIDGLVDAVREKDALQSELVRILVDAALILEAAAA